jgi:hypothetical protein
METLNISEKKNKIKWDYDAEADILYISFGNPKNAEGVDIGEGTIIRIRPYWCDDPKSSESYFIISYGETSASPDKEDILCHKIIRVIWRKANYIKVQHRYHTGSVLSIESKDKRQSN